MNVLGFGLPELIIIAILVLLFFGKDRLPELFRAIGSSIKELRSGLSDSKNQEASGSTPVNKDDAPTEGNPENRS